MSFLLRSARDPTIPYITFIKQFNGKTSYAFLESRRQVANNVTIENRGLTRIEYTINGSDNTVLFVEPAQTIEISQWIQQLEIRSGQGVILADLVELTYFAGRS